MAHIDCYGCGRTHLARHVRDRCRGGRCGPARFPGEPSPTIGGLHLHSIRDGNILWVELYGELDLATVPMLDRELRSASARGAMRVVVDLSGLEFIDSSGLHALLAARENATYALELTRGPAAVQRLFDLTGCTDLFRFLD